MTAAAINTSSLGTSYSSRTQKRGVPNPSNNFAKENDLFSGSIDFDYPNWVYSVADHLNTLQSLKENWDGRGAERIKPSALNAASLVISRLAKRSLPQPQIVPIATGGIQIEWHENGIDLEIEMHTLQSIHVYFEDQQNGREEEVEIRNFNFSILSDPIMRLIQE